MNVILSISSIGSNLQPSVSTPVILQFYGFGGPGVQSVQGNLVNNGDPFNPIIDQSVSTDAGNMATLGTDGLVFVPVQPVDGVQTLSGNLVDNTDPENPVINQSVSADTNNDAILGTDNLLFVPQRVQSVSGDGVDNTDPLNPIVKSIANLSLYATTAAADIPGYLKLVSNVTNPSYNTVPVNVPTGAITATGQLLASLVADASTFLGDPGIVTLTTLGEIRRTSGSGTAEFYFTLYHRDVLGIETLIGTSNLTPPVSTVAYTQFDVSALLNNGTFNTTDRFVVKYYANRISGGSNPHYDFLFGGTNPVRTLFPIPSTLIGDLPIIINITTIDGGTNNYLLQNQSGKVGETDIKTINGNSIFGTGNIVTPDNGITQLTGDVTAGPGNGSQAATLANTTVVPASYTNANITVDSKGRLTAASNGIAGLTSVSVDGTTITGNGTPGNPLVANIDQLQQVLNSQVYS